MTTEGINEALLGHLPRDAYWADELAWRMGLLVDRAREDAAEHGTVHVPDDIQ